MAEIEAAIARLPTPEFRELLHKLNERDATLWDAQIEEDSQNGALDRLYSQMIREEGGEPKVTLDEVLDDPEFS
jgi:hypothetical protein